MEPTCDDHRRPRPYTTLTPDPVRPVPSVDWSVGWSNGRWVGLSVGEQILNGCDQNQDSAKTDPKSTVIVKIEGNKKHVK